MWRWTYWQESRQVFFFFFNLIFFHKFCLSIRLKAFSVFLYLSASLPVDHTHAKLLYVNTQTHWISSAQRKKCKRKEQCFCFFFINLRQWNKHVLIISSHCSLKHFPANTSYNFAKTVHFMLNILFLVVDRAIEHIRKESLIHKKQNNTNKISLHATYHQHFALTFILSHQQSIFLISFFFVLFFGIRQNRFV